MYALALSLLLFHAAQAVPPSAVPATPGVYFQQDDKSWASLQKAAISATTADGLQMFVETGGFTNLDMEAVIQGARAPARLFAARPTLYVRGAASSRDVTLIQLSRKKQSRTFRTSYADSTLENKAGFRKEDIRKTSVKVHSDGIYSVTPEMDLKPGEYLLFLGDVGNSFDFGIEPKK